MAYFRVTSVIKQYPELGVTNIYEVDDYELEVLMQGATGHIIENIMIVPAEFKENSVGKVSFGIKKPEPVRIDLFQEPQELVELTANASDQFSETNQIYKYDSNPDDNTQVVSEIVNPFYYALDKEEQTELSIQERRSLREKELNEMLARDVRELAESINISYKNKTDAIEKILKLEFPD